MEVTTQEVGVCASNPRQVVSEDVALTGNYLCMHLDPTRISSLQGKNIVVKVHG